MARLLSDKIGAALGQPIIVENRPGGAGGTIGGKSVLGAEPDGYTLLMGSTSAVIIAPLVHKTAGYTAVSFAPVAGLSDDDRSVGLASVCSGQLRRRICQPGEGAAEYAPVRLGRDRRVAASRRRIAEGARGIEISHVPYRGGGPALTGLLGGEVHMFFSALTQMLPYIRDGHLRGLAVTSAARSPLAPEIPTMVESGFDQFVTESITFIVAPPGTPLPIRQQISEAVARALATDEIKQAFAKDGRRRAAGVAGAACSLPGGATGSLVANRRGDEGLG